MTQQLKKEIVHDIMHEGKGGRNVELELVDLG